MSESPHLPQRILIVGGGTAGWMAAILFADAWQAHGVDITLMESSSIATVGVGEGSTPKMRRFFEGLGIAESEWMPACNATYKCGIRFPGWSTRPGFESYYHPFFTRADHDFAQSFFHNVELRRRRNTRVRAHPDAFFVSQHLAAAQRAPIGNPPDGYQTDYAYHFDASLIGEFLKEKCLARGVNHVIDTVSQVHRRDDGGIARLDTETGAQYQADLFVDCTGFAGLLIGRTLDVPFTSYAETLFNDCAVALPSPLPDTDEAGLPSQTLSAALDCGWAWKIPLTNRFGNGYVYASGYTDEAAAEAELRAHAGVADDVEARHLKMRVGRRQQSWSHNCLAVGLSQGFIEPLEATALMLVQDTLERFIQRLDAGQTDAAARAHFNDTINKTFDGVRDYVSLHYKLNTRSDTHYWRDCRAAAPASDFVAALLHAWDRRKDVLALIEENSENLVYSHTSWVCLLAGMGRFPAQPRKPKPGQQYADPAVVAQHCQQLLPNYADHRATLTRMGSFQPRQGSGQETINSF